MSHVSFVNALVVDGSGAPPRKLDVTIDRGRIIALDEPGRARDGAVIDLGGLVLSPGFIDIHSHADYTLLRDGRAESAVLQGITSIVPGNCGHGLAPITPVSEALVLTNILGGDPAGSSPTWRTFGDYMVRLREQGVTPNVFPLVAHGALRMSVAGYDDRQLDAVEVRRLAKDLELALAAGAIGLSSGLEYAPGLAADEAELSGIAEGMQDFGALYATHCRNRGVGMPQAATEAVNIATRGKARLQMSHFVRRPNTPDRYVEDSWRVLRHARSNGLSVFADVFPFSYGPTPLAVMIPMRLRNAPHAEMAGKLREPAFRRRVLDGIGGMFETAVRNDLVKSMFVADDGADGANVGLSLADVAEQQKTTPVEAAYWLLENAGDRYQNVTIIENWAVWQDLVAALESDDFYIMGDGVTGALADGRPALTLADWGYAPRFLSQFVRDSEGRVSLESAIHRMTAGPALQIGLSDRGLIAPGYAADLVAFDYETIRSDVTPALMKSPPMGVRHVWVNGDRVVKDGMVLDCRPGVVGLAR